jgi:hypothetical protein
MLGGIANAQSSPSVKTKKPEVGLSPKNLNFGKVPAGISSSPKTVTLTNKSTVDLAAPTVTVTGTGFSLESNGCVSPLAPGGSCPVSVVFTPPKKGNFKKGLLEFSDDAAKSPQKIKLTGVGLKGPSPTPSPTATLTPTATATATATSTASATATSTRTATASATSTNSATATATSTHTATASATSTHTATATATATATSGATASASTTATATATKTATATVTQTPTATATTTSTISPTPTASATSTPTKTATPSITPTPTATSTPVFNVAFVTSTTSGGNLGGLAGADAQCASLASAAHLPAGTYKAWLSTTSGTPVNASSRLGSARGFVRPDGKPFADRISDITAGTIYNALELDENGDDVVGQNVWTGTAANGTATTETCSDWTDGSLNSFGEEGDSTGGPDIWTDRGGAGGCEGAEPFYCFDTSHVTPLTITPVTGRLAFVSTSSFQANFGIADADSVCQSDATAAGLANPTNFLALLATSTASPASRFNLSAMSAPYVRSDGVKIADAPTIASGGELDSGIWQHADGSYAGEFSSTVWTGSSAPNSTGTLASTCQNWSTISETDFGSEGEGNTTDTWWETGATVSCGVPQFLFCLQQ